ncbi:MAG: IclR family transcriptional regulator domain-containing protein, partial [Mesorhizobium sp.]
SLASHVEDARRRGYSIGSQGFEEGVYSAAAPILNAAGLSIGAIALAAPRSRVTRGDLDRYGMLVAAAGREIGERLYGGAATPQLKQA